MAFNFKKKIAEFKAMKRSLPIKIGNLAKNHFVASFRNQGFTDRALNPWAVRKNSNRSDRRTTRKRAILVKTGHLRRSIKVQKARFSSIEIGYRGVPYGVYHNQGSGNLPQRQFMGKSYVLNQKIRRTIKKHIKKSLKK